MVHCRNCLWIKKITEVTENSGKFISPRKTPTMWLMAATVSRRTFNGKRKNVCTFAGENEDEIKAIRDSPKDKHEVSSFLEIYTYYRRFVEEFAKIAASLHQLTAPRTTIARKQVHMRSYRQLKSALCCRPILAYPLKHGKLILDVGASRLLLLSLLQNGEEK